MEKIEFDQKIEILEDVAMQVGGDVRLDYSGRGMYGKVCAGIVCPNADECIEEAAANGIRNAVVDSMGKDFIVYWPRISKSESALLKQSAQTEKGGSGK